MTRVVIGMDPHKRSVTIEVMASDESVLGGGRYGTDEPGYAALLREARRLGVDASRLVFAGPVMPKTEHLKRLTLADVYLDTLVYNGHTTGSDVLWAGVPMVTIQVSHQLPPPFPCAVARGPDADVE